MKPSPLTPENEKGVETNTESSMELATENEASIFFEKVKSRLLNVNHWHDTAGKATAEFQLTDHQGSPISRRVEEGDHFRISIPAPGPVTGSGYDWVKVEAIEDQPDCVAIHVRPATNPLNDQEDIAHFFKDDATSSFIIKREGCKVLAGVYGRNEVPNTEADSTVDKIRNVAVATGAVAGFSKLQWKSLVNGLVDTKPD
ncbi:MAG: hypothetical protein ACXWB9_00165 [Flavisolibacter sp.]